VVPLVPADERELFESQPRFGLHLDSTGAFFRGKKLAKCLKNCGGQLFQGFAQPRSIRTCDPMVNSDSVNRKRTWKQLRGLSLPCPTRRFSQPSHRNRQQTENAAGNTGGVKGEQRDLRYGLSRFALHPQSWWTQRSISFSCPPYRTGSRALESCIYLRYFCVILTRSFMTTICTHLRVSGESTRSPGICGAKFFKLLRDLSVVIGCSLPPWRSWNLGELVALWLCASRTLKF